MSHKFSLRWLWGGTTDFQTCPIDPVKSNCLLGQEAIKDKFVNTRLKPLSITMIWLESYTMLLIGVQHSC